MIYVDGRLVEFLMTSIRSLISRETCKMMLSSDLEMVDLDLVIRKKETLSINPIFLDSRLLFGWTHSCSLCLGLIISTVVQRMTHLHELS